MTPKTRSEIIQIVNTFRAKVVDVNPKTIAIEITGPEGKIDALIELMRPFGIAEVVNTGVVSVARMASLSLKQSKPTKKKTTKKKLATKKKVTRKKK